MALLLAACGGEVAAEPFDADGPWYSLYERPCPEESIATFENFGEAFFRTWCTMCHSSDLAEGQRQGAPLDVNLDTRGGVLAAREWIWRMAADGNEAMPPIGGPSPEERERLGAWLACGAP